MLSAAGLILLGLVLLLVGGEALVRGASGIALLARLTPTVVGLTVVSAGTSAPELVVSLQAGLAGAPDMAIGNVVGSSIFNIAAILGVAALIVPLPILGNTVRLEYPVMLLAVFQLLLLARDGKIDRLEGVYFATALVVFVSYLVWRARRAPAAEHIEASEDVATASFGYEGRSALMLNFGAVAAGVTCLVFGASSLVEGAVFVARSFEVSDAVIGLTVVAAGTSLPELAASAVAAFRGRADIAVANVIGSNLFNILGIAGLTAIVHPLPVPAEIIARDNWWLLGLSALMLPLMRSGMVVSRREGGLLVVLFLTYLAQLFMSM